MFKSLKKTKNTEIPKLVIISCMPCNYNVENSCLLELFMKVFDFKFVIKY